MAILITNDGATLKKGSSYFIYDIKHIFDFTELVCSEIKKGSAIFKTPNFDSGTDDLGYYQSGDKFTLKSAEIKKHLFSTKKLAAQAKIKDLQNQINKLQSI